MPITQTSPILISIPIAEYHDDECEEDQKVCVSGDNLSGVVDRDGCQVNSLSKH